MVGGSGAVKGDNGVVNMLLVVQPVIVVDAGGVILVDGGSQGDQNVGESVDEFVYPRVWWGNQDRGVWGISIIKIWGKELKRN